MPLHAQDLWIVLKAQDMATRALNAYSRSVTKAGVDTRIANNEAAQGALRQTIAQRDLARAFEQNAIAELNLTKAREKDILAAQKQLGLSKALQNATMTNIRNIDAEVTARKQNILAIDRENISSRENIQQLQRTQEQLRRQNTLVEEAGRRAQESSAKWKAFSQSMYAASFTVTAAGFAGAMAMYKAVDAAAEYDRQVRLTFTQVDKGQASLRQLGQVGIQIANQIGVKFEDVQASLYDVFSSMDVSLADATRYVTEFAKAAVAGQTDIDSVSRGTIAILNSFKLSAGDINHVLDLQFKFIQKGIGTYDEWVTKLGQVAPSAIRAGQSLDTMFAALAEASRMSGVASRAATAVARALDAISNPKAIAAMQEFGVTVLDAKGNMLPLVDILTSFRAQLDKLPSEAAKTAAIVDIFKGAGGTIEARRFLQNMLLQKGTLEDFKSILEDTKNSAGSLDQAYATMSGNLQTQAQLIKNRFHSLVVEFGTNLIPVATKFLDIVDRIMGRFDKLSPKTKDMITKFLLLATSAALILGPILGILGVVGSLASALAALGLGVGEVLLIIVGFGLAIIGVGVAFKEMYQKSEAFRNILHGIGDTALNVKDSFIKFVEGVKKKYDEDLAPTLEHLWQVITYNVLPAVEHIVGVIEEKIKPSFDDWASKIKAVVEFGFKVLSTVIEAELIPAINRATTFYYQHKEAIDQVIKVIMEILKWVAIISGSAGFMELIGVIGLIILGFTLWINIMVATIKIIVALIDYLKWAYSEAWKVIKLLIAIFELWAESIGNKITQVINWFKDIPSKLRNAVGDAKSVLSDVGSDIVQGMINGLEGMRDKLKNKISSLTDMIPGVVKDLLDIGSPSKVFKSLGKDTIRGYIIGVDSMQRDVQNSMSYLGNQAVSSNIGYNSGYQSGYNSESYQGSSGKVVNVNTTVNTNEIRPQYNAARLGMLLAGRVG